MKSLLTVRPTSRLEVIDHRSWHPRGINTTMVNEIYAKANIEVTQKGTAKEMLEGRMKEIEKALHDVVKDPEARIKVQRWYPGVVEEITESVHEKTGKGKSKINVEQRLLTEASAALDRRQTLQLLATKEKTVDEILQAMKSEGEAPVETDVEEGKMDLSSLVRAAGATPTAPRPQRRRRQKMRSTPVVGGSLFDKPAHEEETKEDSPGVSRPSGSPAWNAFQVSGHKAEIVVNGESYDIRINDSTLKTLRKGFSGDMLDSTGISIQPDQANVANNLTGFVRNNQLGMIPEEDNGESETSSVTQTKKPGSSNGTPHG